MEVSGAKKLKTFEVENAKLKKLLAELMMDVSTLKEMLRKTSEARCATQSCKLGHDRETIPMLRDAPMSGLGVAQIWLRNCGPKPPLKKTAHIALFGSWSADVAPTQVIYLA